MRLEFYWRRLVGEMRAFIAIKCGERRERVTHFAVSALSASAAITCRTFSGSLNDMWKHESSENMYIYL